MGVGGKAAIASAMLFAWLGASAALAQAAPTSPSIAQAVAPTREEITRPDLTPTPRAPSRLTVDGGVERAPCALTDPRFAAVTITLANALFANLHGVSANLLRPAYADMIGKTLPISAVCDIRDAAATILRDAGYLAAVQVPPQTIKDGIVYFDVLMPKLVAVQVRGRAGKSAQLIAAYLGKLTGRPVFNEHEAERYLLLARDLPGYDVRLTLRAADDGTPGDVIGEVSVLRQPLAIDFNVQDYGPTSVGRFGGLLRGEFYDVLGHGDRLSLGVFSTADFSEQQVLQAGYDLRVGPEGLTLGGNFTYAWTHPTVPRPLDIRSRTLVANLNARYPFVRAQAADLAGAIGFDFVNQNVANSGQPLNQEHVRTLYAQLSGDAADRRSVQGEGGFSAAEPRWRASGVFEIRQGLGILDATDRCRTTNGSCRNPTYPPPIGDDPHPRGIILRMSAGAEWRPIPKVALVVTSQGQYAPNPTLSYEQFSAGNYTVGRGYDPGAIRGDSGVGLSGEFRFGSLVPHSNKDLALQPYAFVDSAWSWFTQTRYQPPSDYRLVSAGGGVRAAWGSHARLDLVFAVPIEDAGAQHRGDKRVLLSLTTRLLPWR